MDIGNRLKIKRWAKNTRNKKLEVIIEENPTELNQRVILLDIPKQRYS